MIEWYHIYLFTRIDYFRDFVYGLQVFAIMGSIAVIILTIIRNVDDSEWDNGLDEFAKSKWKWLIIVFAVFNSLLYYAIPTQKEFAAIYLIPKVVNNESVQKVAGNVGDSTVNLSKLFLVKTEEWLKSQVEPEKIVEKVKEATK